MHVAKIVSNILGFFFVNLCDTDMSDQRFFWLTWETQNTKFIISYRQKQGTMRVITGQPRVYGPHKLNPRIAGVSMASRSNRDGVHGRYYIHMIIIRTWMIQWNTV